PDFEDREHARQYRHGTGIRARIHRRVSFALLPLSGHSRIARREENAGDKPGQRSLAHRHIGRVRNSASSNSAMDTGRPKILRSDVTPCSRTPQGTMPPKWDKSGSIFTDRP